MQRKSESVSELCIYHMNRILLSQKPELYTFPLPVLPTVNNKFEVSSPMSWSQETDLPIPILSPDLTWKERSCSTLGPA